MKFIQAALPALAAMPAALAAETIVGVYMFHRHGDRTPKITPPTTLTDLGYKQVFLSGRYYRDLYISPVSALHISGISSDKVNLEQIAASAPVDPVLQSSAQAFLQAFYPPTGDAAATETLGNGSTVTAPMHGYQLIPVNTVETGSGSENANWLQDATSCYNAEVSSNNYFFSPEYMQLLKSTKSFYQRLLPALQGVFAKSDANYFNAYTIYDYINVQEIHNPGELHSGEKLITAPVMNQLHALANAHEFNLAYNKSSPIRAIAGRQLAAEIVDFFDASIAAKGATGKFGIQFGSYGTFFSFFGAAGLAARYPNFHGIVNYASAMSFELFTTKKFDTYPAADDLMIRFFFHNGTTSDKSIPQQYALFDQPKMELSWAEFKTHMAEFSVGDTKDWCHLCGNNTGTCLPYSRVPPQGLIGSGGGNSGMSNAVAGVIGAMVTLCVILIIELAILFIGGYRIISKKRLVAGKSVANGGP